MPPERQQLLLPRQSPQQQLNWSKHE